MPAEALSKCRSGKKESRSSSNNQGRENGKRMQILQTQSSRFKDGIQESTFTFSFIASTCKGIQRVQLRKSNFTFSIKKGRISKENKMRLLERKIKGKGKKKKLHDHKKRNRKYAIVPWSPHCTLSITVFLFIRQYREYEIHKKMCDVSAETICNKHNL